MRNERLVVSRERLLEEVWGYDPTAMTNTIDVFISNLRRKLEDGGEARLLHTKRGAGYVLKRRDGLRRRSRTQGARLAAHWATDDADGGRRGRWPVRWRLAGVSAGLTLVILLVFGAVVGQVATSRIRDDFNRRGQRRRARHSPPKFSIFSTGLATVYRGPELDRLRPP